MASSLEDGHRAAAARPAFVPSDGRDRSYAAEGFEHVEDELAMYVGGITPRFCEGTAPYPPRFKHASAI